MPVSKEAEKFIIEKENAPKEKITMIHHGIPPEIFTQQSEAYKKEIIEKEFSEAPVPVIRQLSGSETSLFIKNRESTKHVPIIVITGLSFPEQLAEISTTGIDGYIAKPVSAAELLSSVNKIFND